MKKYDLLIPCFVPYLNAFADICSISEMFFLNVPTPYIARVTRLEIYMARPFLQTFINIYCCKGTLKRSICFRPFLIKTIYIWSKQNMHLLSKHYKNMMRHKRSFMSIRPWAIMYRIWPIHIF